jgi:glutamyl-tRNA synthetase
MSVRVRFAPSPTGYLHVGGARTALFNWLYARHHGGTFVLRIEDTDAERSSDEMVRAILTGLRWMGVDWDEGPEVGGPHGPYTQTARFSRHRERADALVRDGHAYYCYCAIDRLQAERAAAEARGEGWIYDRQCLRLDAAEVAAMEAAGLPRAVRVRVPEGETTFADQVHGPITVDHSTIEDFVIVRSDGLPTYQLSVVCDDIDMAITHVIRGDDHISNTPKQIILYRALGAAVPAFAHVPLILGPDKKRLSKRHGATAVGEYEAQGILTEAFVNFLALLGWSPGSDEEIFTCDELIARFSLDGISGGNAVFNPEKLDWFNAQHLARLSPDALLARVRPEIAAAGLWDDALAGERREWLTRVLSLLVPRARRLGDFALQLVPFLGTVESYDPAAVDKYLKTPDLARHVSALADALRSLEPFDEASAEARLRAIADSGGVKFGALVHAARIAVTGRAVSPGLFETLVLIGRDRVVARLEALARFLAERGGPPAEGA